MQNSRLFFSCNFPYHYYMYVAPGLTKNCTYLLTLCLLAFGCRPAGPGHQAMRHVQNKPYNHACKVIHVFVALCDNKYQGIVPVPPKIGNGQNAATNLYWGNSYGVSTYFTHSKDWQLLTTRRRNGIRLEQQIFKHRSQNYYLVADAYDGRYIKNCITDYLNSCAGRLKDTVKADKQSLGIDGNATLLAYVGHNGMMDFHLADVYKNTDNQKRDCIMLACYSKRYFGYYARNANIRPLVWTTGLMCPEAYTLYDAIAAYIKSPNDTTVRNAAVAAYDKYQKCGLKAAQNLLVGGW